MPGSFQVFVNGAPADPSVQDSLTSLEIEENAEMPGAIRFSVAVSATEDGDLSSVSDPIFAPFANVAVVAAVDDAKECIFDGYVLTQKLHLDRGNVGSTLEASGQDASWLMNLEEKAREWADVTDSDVATSIFGEYNFSPGPDNSSEDSPSHTSDGHSLMQRATDIQFLAMLARRTGKLCRVACGSEPGQYTGYFAKPSLDAEPSVTLDLQAKEGANTGPLDFEWDVTGPTQVTARANLYNDASEDGVGQDTTESGLSSLSDQTQEAFSGKPVKALLTSAVDDAGELEQRAKSVLREAAFFVRCSGQAEASALGKVLRVGEVVGVSGAGAVFSGKYLVWQVSHKLTADSHDMRFVLVRNAVGSPSGGGGGLLGGLL